LIKFFKNRELAQRFNINLAKWKRWSRDFLPPDPLGGMQSGYARHYSIDDAFKVYLGGHLVSIVKFTIPETQQILEDLQEWLTSVGIYLNAGTYPKYDHSVEPVREVTDYVIFIEQPHPSRPAYEYSYTIRGIISDNVIRKQDLELRQERYFETLIPQRKHHRSMASLPGLRMLNITAVFRIFLECLDLPQKRFTVPQNI
jgi:hypothetical protein